MPEPGRPRSGPLPPLHPGDGPRRMDQGTYPPTGVVAVSAPPLLMLLFATSSVGRAGGFSDAAAAHDTEDTWPKVRVTCISLSVLSWWIAPPLRPRSLAIHTHTYTRPGASLVARVQTTRISRYPVCCGCVCVYDFDRGRLPGRDGERSAAVSHFYSVETSFWSAKGSRSFVENLSRVEQLVTK